MYRLIDLKLNNRVLPLFSFLKDNPTRTLRKGEHVLMTYWKPIGECLGDFGYKGITVTVSDTDGLESYLSDGWEVARNYDVAYCGDELLTTLQELEQECLKQSRAGNGLLLDGSILYWVSYGITEPEEATDFVRQFYLAGYSYEETTQVFSKLAKPDTKLLQAFITTLNRLYQEDMKGE